MLIFYFLCFLVLYGALNVVLRKDPIVCALHLVLSMVGVAGLFFNLEAHFIAGVQLVVYAGAAMVLFVMVIMLFDFKKESSFTFLWPSFLKALLCTFIFGLLAGNILRLTGSLNQIITPERVETRELSMLLFSKYVFLFEWLGLLLLIIAVGVVILSRGKKDDFDH